MAMNQNSGTEFFIGLSWDFYGGEKFDIDASVVMVDDLGSIIDCVYYNKLESDCGSINHSGDQRDGSADGYDETIQINLATIPYQV